MKLPSNMSHNFAQVPKADIPRSSFDRSSGYKTTFDAGRLIPFFSDEALPGDTFNLRVNAFARLATPLKPVMDNMYLDTFFFAVPIRLIWDNFQRFNGEQRNPTDPTDYVTPKMTSTAVTGYNYSSMHDYLGIPVGVPGLVHHSLYHRAYNLIWNEWFRDQNLQDSAVNDTDDGPDTPEAYFIRRRGKRHDYFTSCLPWPQKGPAVELPLGTTLPIISNQLQPNFEPLLGPSTIVNMEFSAAAGVPVLSHSGIPFLGGTAAMFGDTTGLQGDLSQATAATINALREAFQIQRLFERDARGGTRYTEIIRSHFGVVSPDARLQRPEYLGGGSAPINVHPVPQQGESGTTPQGNLAGFGTGVVSNQGFVKSFTEHCVILGLVSARADLTYQQGLERRFSRSTRFDFYWPALANIGEQAVLNKEIYAQGSVAPVADGLTFGYQERFAEYRYKQSLVTGLFRSSHPQSLDLWHLSQDFTALPVLNTSFIEDNPPIDRVIAVPSEPHFLLDAYFNLKCARPMPIYGVPGMIDHF